MKMSKDRVSLYPHVAGQILIKLSHKQSCTHWTMVSAKDRTQKDLRGSEQAFEEDDVIYLGPMEQA